MADEALAVHAVVRNRGAERALEAVRHGDRERPFELVAVGPVAAVVTPSAAEDPGDEDRAAGASRELRVHARIVERLLDRSAVLPLPFGIRARSRAAVEALLAERSDELREALDFLENAYELRLHVRRRPGTPGGEEPPGLGRLFEELRVRARSARRLPTRDGSDLSAAFLVPRGEWIRFVERATEWEGLHPGLDVDVTGPWPPYDFVRVEQGSRGPSGTGATDAETR